MSDSNFNDWFAGKELTTDWTSRYFPQWAAMLAERQDQPLEVLEIGSWEGRAAIFFLRLLKNCRVTCIDTFEGSFEHTLVPNWANLIPDMERRFDSNMAEFGSRVTKMKSRSSLALAQLSIQGRQFDLVYVDGSHKSADALSDAVLTWPMVRPRGIVIFDDYEWKMLPDEIDRPKLGIDGFLAVHARQYRELYKGYQLIIEKVAAGA